jgi:signal transduction histidine kinase
LWVGSIGGVEYYEDGKFTDFTERLGLRIGDVDFWSIQQDRHGALWFGTNKGLIQYQDGAATSYTTENGLPNNDVKAIHEARDGSLWIATYGGLAFFRGGNGEQTGERTNVSTSPYVSSPRSIFTEADGLASNRVRAIFEDEQGTLWIGTADGGLSRFRKGKFVNYTTRNGLYSDGVFQILEDARGWFWMSSNQGIYRVRKQELEDFAAGKTKSITSTAFGKSDGMLNTECNGGRQPAGIKTRDGKLWFPTQDGVAIIDPEAVPFNPQPPPVVIESASVEGASVPLGGGVKLAPQQDNLEIRYTGLSFIKPEQIRFRYRLEGLDENWTEAGTRRAAYYPYLPPGRYTFRVIAANSDNVWNEQGAAIEIVVLPPFYRTSWFTVLVICALAVIAFVFYQRREARFKREQIAQQEFSRRLIVSQEAERRRIAAELHDSLGQHLLIIKNRAALGEQFAPNQSQTKEQFDEINAAAVKAIGEVRAIAYNLRPLNLERLGLTTVLEEMIENVGHSAGIQFSMDIEPLDNLFSPEDEISFYRIIQESVSNIVKHSGATKANVEIWRQDGELHTAIRDNGRGFNPEASINGGKGRGLGLTSISERVRMLGGMWTINSNVQQGTTLNIRVPMSDQQKSTKR